MFEILITVVESVDRQNGQIQETFLYDSRKVTAVLQTLEKIDYGQLC
jgi:hypothetical protein